MTTQPTGAAELPEARRLADAIDPFVRKESPDHLTSKVAADELRRLHAENARLSELCDKWNIECDEFREDNKRLAAQVEALRAQPAGAATPAAQEPVGVITGKLGDICQFRSTTMRKGDAVYAAPQPAVTAGAVDALRTAAQAVVDRWDTPLWKDAPATAEYIGMLRAALAAQRATHQGDQK